MCEKLVNFCGEFQSSAVREEGVWQKGQKGLPTLEAEAETEGWRVGISNHHHTQK